MDLDLPFPWQLYELFILLFMYYRPNQTPLYLLKLPLKKLFPNVCSYKKYNILSFCVVFYIVK